MRIKTVTLAVLAALCLFQSVRADEAAEDDGDDGGDEQTTLEPTTEPPPPVFDVIFNHKVSDVNSIEVDWESDDSFNDEVKRYYLVVVREGSENRLTSPDLESDTRSYLIEDLVHESDYEICLNADLVNGTTIERCDHFFTIPFVRDDSLIILFCVLGYIVLMILLGYLCWSYAKKKAEAEEEEEEEEEGEKEGNEALLGKQRPQSAGIDDRDIPYITPPLHELQKEGKGKPSVEV